MPRLAWICPPSPGAPVEARAAEEAGLDALVLPHDGAREIWPTLERVASDTQTLDLIPVTPQPVTGDPLDFARRVARIADLAPGRLVVGLTVGDPERDGHPLRNWERMSRMRVVLGALRDLLAGERVSIASPHLTLEGRLEDAPAGPPPLWMLADGPSSAGMAAELADGLVVEASGEAHRDVLAPFRASAPRAPVAVLSEATTLQEAVEAGTALHPDLLAVRSEGDPFAAIDGLRG